MGEARPAAPQSDARLRDERYTNSPSFPSLSFSQTNTTLTTASTTTATRASFDRAVTTLRWLGTNGLRFFLQYWYAKQPLFWIPAGWVPGYVEWLLSFPRAPIGSVSVQIWDIACTSVVQLAGEALAAVWALEVERRRARARGQKKAQMQGRSAAGGGTGREKEL